MMRETELSAAQKKADVDLWIILIITVAAFGLFAAFRDQAYAILKNRQIHVLLRLCFGAACQFGIAGLGITAVMIFRREDFSSYGLKKKGALPSILACTACFIPFLLFITATKQFHGYFPLQTVLTTPELMKSALGVRIPGMALTALVWGFFEAFNYVVISEKINRRYPKKNQWLDWGAITCAVMCILIHGAVGVTFEGLIEMFTIAIIIYGMILAKERTGNAWGCIFNFILLWNAF